MLLATAGNETVTKLLATAFYELWRNPDERRALVREPALTRTPSRRCCASIRRRSTRVASRRAT